VLEHDPPRADEVEPAVPAALAEIAARAMEKDPEHRYRSARALARELRHWLDENATAADASAATEPEELPLYKRPRVALAAAGTALVVAAGAWLWSGGQPDEAPAAGPVAATTQEPTPAAAPPRDTAPAPAAAVPAAAAAPATPEAASAAVAAAPAAVEPSPPAAAVTPPPATVAPARPAPTTVARAATAAKDSAKEAAARERERRSREARTAAAPAMGSVRIAVSPWGTVEVDGTPVGTAPPLNELTLSEGRHQIVIRNADFPPFSAAVNVTPGQPVNVKHKFGS
jgi:eukaryotic-like serine/threonine-protein kinase